MLSRWDPTASPWNPSSPELEPGVIASSRLRVQGWNGDCYIPKQFMIKSTNWGRKSRRRTGNCIRVGECTIRQCFSRILFILRLWSCVNPFLNKWRSINTYDTLQRPSLVGIAANSRNSLGLQQYSHLRESWAAELFPLYSETFDRNHFGSIAQTHRSWKSLERDKMPLSTTYSKNHSNSVLAIPSRIICIGSCKTHWKVGSHLVSTPESISQVVLENINWNFTQILKIIRHDVIRNMTSPAPPYALSRNFQVHRLRQCTTRVVTAATQSSTCETQTPMKCH